MAKKELKDKSIEDLFYKISKKLTEEEMNSIYKIIGSEFRTAARFKQLYEKVKRENMRLRMTLNYLEEKKNGKN